MLLDWGAKPMLSTYRRIRVGWLCALLWIVAAVFTPRPGAAQEAEKQAQPQADTSAAAPNSPSDDPPTFLPHPQTSRFWISGQANFIFQTHPEFHAQYSGPNSFRPHYEKATSRVVTFFSGVKLSDSTELLFDVEETGGAGLSTALGIAGFTNLDVVRNPTLGKAPYIARGLFHQVFALSHEEVEVARGPFSGFAKLPARRLEVRFGKFSIPDFLDLNTVGTDSHFQFMNWVIDNNGAYDYAAETRGYTVGLIADYESKAWSVQFAEALMPTVANGPDLQWNLRRAHAENYEFTLHRAFVPGKAGAIRLLAYNNTANMGVYRVAINRYLAGEDHSPEITHHPLQSTGKYGFGVNLEQSLSPTLSLFSRFGWNNGRTESYAYTEVDQTVQIGAGLYGRRWRRPHDRAGVCFISNAISGDHRRYLALGGLGFLLGDGGLIYGREKIIESYYTAHLWKGWYVGPDLQYVVNPGYNQVRGPAIVPGFRTHFEF